MPIVKVSDQRLVDLVEVFESSADLFDSRYLDHPFLDELQSIILELIQLRAEKRIHKRGE